MSLLIEATIKALDKSIEHYERLDACTTLAEIEREGIYGVSCELCRVFDVDDDCGTCPVRLDTGQLDCKGSPWGLVMFYFKENTCTPEVLLKLKGAIHDELEYLRMLRRRCDETPV